MATIKRVTFHGSTDGRQQLAKVVFTPQVPDPANQHDVEVVFEVKKYDGGIMDTDSYAVILLSATNVDTREPYALSREQRSTVIEEVVSQAQDHDSDLW